MKRKLWSWTIGLTSDINNKCISFIAEIVVASIFPMRQCLFFSCVMLIDCQHVPCMLDFLVSSVWYVVGSVIDVAAYQTNHLIISDIAYFHKTAQSTYEYKHRTTVKYSERIESFFWVITK